MSESTEPSILQMTTQIVSAHVSRTTIEAAALPELIRTVHQALASAVAPPEAAERPEPAVPVKKSVFPDHIVCLEDGRQFKTLKRHLQNVYGMTPAQYRARWGLPDTYPMVAPSYAAHRSSLAKSFGLGQRPAPGAAETPADEEGAEADAAPATEGGKRKAA